MISEGTEVNSFAESRFILGAKISDDSLMSAHNVIWQRRI